MIRLGAITLLFVVSIVAITFVADILLLFCLPFVIIFVVVNLLCHLDYFAIFGKVLRFLSITTNTTHGVVWMY